MCATRGHSLPHPVHVLNSHLLFKPNRPVPYHASTHSWWTLQTYKRLEELDGRLLVILNGDRHVAVGRRQRLRRRDLLEAWHAAEADDGGKQLLVLHVGGRDDAHGVGGAGAGLPAGQHDDGLPRPHEAAVDAEADRSPDSPVDVGRPFVHTGLWSK